MALPRMGPKKVASINKKSDRCITLQYPAAPNLLSRPVLCLEMNGEPRYIILDLEATCWEGMRSPDMETIEVGAVVLDSPAAPVEGEFGAFVRPVVHPTLSEFCRRLTSIRQEDVDGADLFPVVLERLQAWIGPEPFRLCS